MNTFLSKIVIVLVLGLLAGGAVYWHERQSILADIEATFDTRAQLVSSYITLMSHNVHALEALIEAHGKGVASSSTVDRAIAAIKHFPDYNVWGVSGLASEDGMPELSGSLTGSHVLLNPSPAVRHELVAALHLDPLFDILINNIPETVWVYYTSASGFIHIAPDPPVADFHYSPTLYLKPFWTEAAPERNPEQRQVISKLYEDYYGQGLMISISAPVEMEGEFRGVVSLDLGIDLLRKLTSMGHAPGESLLVDERNRIVARHGAISLDERYEVDVTSDGFDTRMKVLWLAREVTPGELRLLHRLPQRTLAAAAMARSLPAWGILVALAVLLLLSLRLHTEFRHVRQLMCRDSLTNLLNRRGLEAELSSLRQFAQETGYKTALLLFDIDHFKRINDTYGHVLGDEVLTILARRIITGLHEHDRVCRWGGEEILVLLVHDPDVPAMAIAERLRRNMQKTPMTAESVSLTISGGLTDWGFDESFDAAVMRADDYLYRAKELGRNRIENGPGKAPESPSGGTAGN